MFSVFQSHNRGLLICLLVSLTPPVPGKCLMSSTTLWPTLIQVTNQTSDNLWTDKIYSKPNISFKGSSNRSDAATPMQLYPNWAPSKGKPPLPVAAPAPSIKSSNPIHIANQGSTRQLLAQTLPPPNRNQPSTIEQYLFHSKSSLSNHLCSSSPLWPTCPAFNQHCHIPPSKMVQEPHSTLVKITKIWRTKYIRYK